MGETTIKVGNAPCSWGTLEFEGVGGGSIDYATMLDELVATGYTGTELGDWGFMPTTPAALSAALMPRKLAMNGAFVPVALRRAEAHAAGIATAIRTARLLADTAQRTGQVNAPFIVLADDNGTDPVRTGNAGRITPAQGLSDAEWTTFSRGADQIAHAVRAETGLRTVFHHHCAGYIETHDEIARLLAMTDTEVLGLVFDTGHYAYGNGGSQTLMQALDEFADRIWYVHFKDCSETMRAQAGSAAWDYFTAIRNGIFCELGQGSVDFPAVKQWLAARSYQGFITVEQDVLPGMGSPQASAQRNREYLRSIGL
jgi:inosose dehydratase